jgi:ribosomal protein S28E/S33
MIKSYNGIQRLIEILRTEGITVSKKTGNVNGKNKIKVNDILMMLEVEREAKKNGKVLMVEISETGEELFSIY